MTLSFGPPWMMGFGFNFTHVFIRNGGPFLAFSEANLGTGDVVVLWLSINNEMTSFMSYKWIMFGVVGALLAGNAFERSFGRDTDLYEGLRAIVDKHVDSISKTNLSIPSVATIHKAGHEYLNALNLSEKEKADFVFSHLNQELIEMEKRELLIKILLKHASQNATEPKRFDGFARYLGRQHTGSLESSLFATIMMSELHGSSIFSEPEWAPILKEYLNGDHDFRSSVADYLLDKGEHGHPATSEGAVAQEWSADEKQEIADAVLRTQRIILTRRLIEKRVVGQSAISGKAGGASTDNHK